MPCLPPDLPDPEIEPKSLASPALAGEFCTTSATWKIIFLYSEMKVKVSQCVQLFVTPLTVAHEALLSMGFSRQEYWSGLPCPPPGDLPDPGNEPVSLMSLHWHEFFTTEPSGEKPQFHSPQCIYLFHQP